MPQVTIPLSKGYEAIIDARDIRLVYGIAWHALTPKGKVYAAHGWRDGIGGPVKKTYMHHVIADAIGAPYRHPLNGNSLDCRRENFGVFE